MAHLTVTSVSFEDSLAATVRLLRGFCVEAIVPGSEWGVHLAECVSEALQLRRNGSFLDRRNKEVQQRALESAGFRVRSLEAFTCMYTFRYTLK